ncbi:MAG: CPBP family intramembrane metalloprotease [Proteobacteria bacterium]|nr:CPBP family intramembrane metalloprotease [Pseudomonadota bacterium]
MLRLLAVSVIVTIALGEFYVAWQRVTGLQGWQSIVLLHGLIALVLFASSRKTQAQFKVKFLDAWSYIPAVMVLIGSAAMAIIYPSQGRFGLAGLNGEFLIASCTVIPLFEEVVFRGGVSRILFRAHPGVWSGYFSGLVFSVAHTTPSFARVLGLQVGAPLGPFLLALICEFLVRRTNSLLPAIAFHCACNSTVLIFQWWSPGWLDRLSVFYLK